MKSKIKTPRSMAVDILGKIELKSAYAEPLLDDCLSSHYLPNVHDRRLLTELVYGTLRMKGYLDWLIKTFYRGDAASLDTCIKNILRTGLYQLIYTSRIPLFAIVDEAVKLTKIFRPGYEALVNAILRTYLRKKDNLPFPRQEESPLEYISVVASHPEWMVKKWVEESGIEATLTRCKANNETPPAVLRINRLKTTREKAINELREEGIGSKATFFSPDGLVVEGPVSSLRETGCYGRGHIQVQDEGSQMIAYLLDPQPGEEVLDICAGLGIKTTHLAELMNNQGRVLALDINKKKLTSLRDLAGRLGTGIVDAKKMDATLAPDPSLHKRFDRILVDAPCSGLGTLRRNPELKWRIKPEDIRSVAELQKKILHNAAPCLKEGGMMVYSVCTVSPEENEAVVDDFISRHRDFQQVPPPGTVMDELINGKDFYRTNPSSHGMDGFFAALLRKKPV